MIACVLALAVLRQVPGDSTALAGARNPAYAPNGQVAVSRHGNLWVRQTDGRWTALTRGSFVDRAPAWTAHGDSVVFSSNRDDGFSLWVVGTAGGDPVRLTNGPADGEPAVAPDGRVYFIRGLTTVGRLWVRNADGTEHRVTDNADAESWPAVSRQGTLAYVTTRDDTGHLHVRGDAGPDRTIVNARGLAGPAWSPDGSRLAYTASAPRASVYVTSVDGAYTNLVSSENAEAAWNPDGAHLLLVERPPPDVAYNGDPNRLGDRDAYDAFPPGGRMWTVDAPVPPDAGLAPVPPAPVNRAERNAETFDRFFARQTALYYSGSSAAARRTQWDALRSRFRERAVAAGSDED
ncbi:MAG: TolB family protein, partial [Gemmatimonadaceae bacterium]